MCQMQPRCCQECGTPLTDRDPRAVMCSANCRKIWHNRRMTRGAELYDLFMAMRYERGMAKVYGLWALMCRMGQAWREEDRQMRSGRASYLNPQDSRARAARYAATRH
jgi:hypothetical protein